MNERMRGAALSYVYMLIHIIVSFINVPLMLHFMGDSEYGLYQIVGSLMAYINVFETSISSGVLRFYCKAKADNDKSAMENTLALARLIYRYMSLIIAIFGIFLTYIFTLFYSKSFTETELFESKWLLMILIANLLVTMSNAVYLSAITAYERYTFLRLLMIFSQILQPILCYICLRFAPYAITIGLIMLVLNIVVALMRVVYFKKFLPTQIMLHKKDKAFAKKIIVFSSGILLASIADQIFWKTDQIILGRLFNTTVAAVYSVGAQIYYNYMNLGLQISTVFFPKISLLASKENGLSLISDLFIKIGRLTYDLLFLILVGFVLWGKVFLKLWVGDNYDDAYYVAIIVMIPFTIDLIQHSGLTILQVLDKYDFRAKLYFIAACLNIVSTVILANIWAGKGAALSTGLTMFFTSGLILNIYYKNIGLDIKRFWKEIFVISVKLLPCLGVGCAIRIAMPIDNILMFGIQILIFVVIYLIWIYIVCFNEYEKNLIKKIVKK